MLRYEEKYERNDSEVREVGIEKEGRGRAMTGDGGQRETTFSISTQIIIIGNK